jgi:hypothetical protein
MSYVVAAFSDTKKGDFNSKANSRKDQDGGLKKIMISIVCVYNDQEVLSNYLLKSLDLQISDYQLILVDNTSGIFKSAAEALNYGGKKAKNEYIMFVHQDMELRSQTWLEDAEEFLDSIINIGIAGVAGKSKDKWWAITNIEDGIPSQRVSPYRISTPVKVQTIDECLIIIPKKIFQIIQFDEVVCDNWHLYGVDYCLNAKKASYDAYVLPLFAYHRSKAYSLSEKYYETLNKILKKHKSEKYIRTTVDDWITFYPLSIQRRFPNVKSLIISFLSKLSI